MDRTTASPVGRPNHNHQIVSKLKRCPTPGLPDNNMDRVENATPPDKSTRSSFSSVRENDSNLAQTFTTTKVSSYSKEADEAIEDQPPLPTEMTTQTQFVPPVTQPNSRLHGSWFPAVAAEGFQGWKQIGVKGRQASKSYGDLQALKIVWSTPATPPRKKDPERPPPGQSSIEKLPAEILGQIIDHLVLDVPPNGISARNVDLMSLLLTSRTLHSATLNSLYKNITIPHSRIFRKFLTHISQNQELGTIVRRLDFCHFNPTTLFSTASERATTRNLTPETLLQCLELTPFLREFLAQEYIEDEINASVLRKLFFGLERLQGIDFCGCSSTNFKNAFQSILQADWPDFLPISRLCMHKCITLSSSVFETLLPRLGDLTHLDLAGTRVTDEALQSIPHTARITHLNLSKCRLLTADAIIDFVANHPAASGLVFLSLGVDARSHQLLDEDALDRLIPTLPPTLRSLSLKGSRMAPSHIDLLRPLTKHLEELALGRRLKITDIDRLFVPDESNDGEDASKELEWVPHTLRYLDLSDYTAVELDLITLFGRNTSIMKRYSAPLDVIEIPDDMYARLATSPVVKQLGWVVTENGSRAWLVRLRDLEDGPRDSGLRPWKMGASFWGMRKIPIACAEVGGMYGSYMFKRKL
ncbi:hypothetical protein GGS23DRAFT_334259 [Durotheca rogersii]|uniref:uncharacterized protein n=1 Tax=Durotheca rogersii TaxID=419775 RepID=UPI0022200FA1|nr:uncharacterized protein GGS23DRAFT_334259 [Durotheca rogersii]KAI5858301.1 hypothetical protein GGS23DRAFT_334259 [Durotheca rogersii]